jgi:VIT1/CCC1 family predicted Fe2+/Mn2+ transporter
MFRHSLKIGFSFGVTSGIITTLGLMMGLNSGTHSRAVVIGGILTIAVADAFSDALGIHMSEESENRHTARQIWEATLATFVAKFVVALTFVVPILLFPLSTAIGLSVAWGLSLLSFFSFLLAREQKARAWKVILEHLLIALAVIFIAQLVGDLISQHLGDGVK